MKFIVTEPFPWGPIVDIHEIGNISIVEFYPEIFEGAGTGKFDHTRTKFHAYVDGVDVMKGSPTLDHALLVALGFKHDVDGHNSRWAKYAARCLGLSDTRIRELEAACPTCGSMTGDVYDHGGCSECCGEPK